MPTPPPRAPTTQPELAGCDLSGSPQALLLPIFDRYLEFYTASSDHTARAKQYDIRKFEEFLAQFHHVPSPEKLVLGHWTHAAVTKFVEHILLKGERPATAARRLATIKHMGRTLAETIPGFINPAREVRPPRFQVEKPQGLTRQEIEQLREKAAERWRSKPTFNRLRSFMLITFLLETGLRVDEARLLRLSQISEDLQWIREVRTKGKRYRTVYISSRLRGELQTYLEARTKEIKRRVATVGKKFDQQLPLFISLYGATPEDPDSFLLSPKAIWSAVADCDPSIHPHRLRHTFAMGLLQTSGDIRLVAQALGHADVRTTMRYTERTSQEIAAAIERKE